MKTPSIAYERHGWLTVLVHGPCAVRDSDWEAYVETFVRLQQAGHLAHARTLVFTPGGQAPSAAQRKVVSDRFPGMSVPTAVMTDSWVARAAVTAMSWFNPFMQAYGSADLDNALAYLGVHDDAQCGAVWQSILRLSSTVQLPLLRKTS